VIVVLQYWLENVSPEQFHDRARLESDPLYARHFANFNVFTYLAYHGDCNRGNYLVSTDPANPRVFSVDNGIAFDEEESNQGTDYRRIKVKRLPRDTVERLRALTREDLDRVLGVLAHFESREGELVRADPAWNIDPTRQVRHRKGGCQFGLTRREIDSVWRRLRSLLKKVDRGGYELF
jgi:hypothetical protein